MENKSGVQPVEFKVLVLPDPVQDKTSGGLFIPDTTKDREKHRTVKATLVAVGGNAFEGWDAPLPVVGDRVYLAMNAGMFVTGFDGLEYRMINDKDIVAVITAE
jgi:co-chaperonin GroES (HSP10)